jgi:hypothetical protein
MSRLKNEYSVYADYEKATTPPPLGTGDDAKKLDDFQKKISALAMERKQFVYLRQRVAVVHIMEEWPPIRFHKTMEKTRSKGLKEIGMKIFLIRACVTASRAVGPGVAGRVVIGKTTAQSIYACASLNSPEGHLRPCPWPGSMKFLSRGPRR